MGSNGHARPLRIAQVSPLFESVPPRAYGGTERVVAYLTEELVARGHDVTLFASGDSRTCARLVPCCPRALRAAGVQDGMPAHLAMIDEVCQRASQFDIVHFHVDYLHFPITSRESFAHVTTLHGRLDLPDIEPIYSRFRHVPVVSISRAQRAPLPYVAWQATVHHGLPDAMYRANRRGGDYLVFLGRISPEKRVDRAIEIARRAGRKLVIAAKLDRSDRDYYREKIEPLMKQPHVEYVGEIDERGKQELLAGALALVFPIDWPEPFGLVMIEALACGTPVIAWRCGSVPEVIDQGVTGFVCDDLVSAVAAVDQVGSLSRETCRRVFEDRFSAPRMAEDYIEVYRRLVEASHERREQPGPRGLLHSRDHHARR